MDFSLSDEQKMLVDGARRYLRERYHLEGKRAASRTDDGFSRQHWERFAEFGWLALPIAAGVFASWGLVLRPEIAALTMSGSSFLVAVNALLLKRLRLPGAPAATAAQPTPAPDPEPVSR